ncbi:MAG: RNA polymerase sporulation sigma factor SigK [Clostridia bacterium]|nr:RNA polymerase sporulation sigma factor SigK [Clostridia bacterium]
MFFDFINFIISKVLFFCGSVIGDSFPKPLSSEEEEYCLTEYKQNGNKLCREKLIKHNLRLVAHIVKKYQCAEDSDDLISTGTIGLIKAIDSFDASKGVQLATYTARCIENEILMLLRANKKYLGTISLSDVIGVDKEGNELTLLDLLSDDGESVFMKVERKTERKKLLEIIKTCLSDREYKIICLRYGLKGSVPLPQREVASFLKISRSYISRIEKRAIEKIRAEIKKNGIVFN